MGARNVAKTDYTVILVATAAMPSLKDLEPVIREVCTERQRHTLALVGAGYSIRQAADVLDLETRPSASTYEPRSETSDALLRSRLDAAVEPLAQGGARRGGRRKVREVLAETDEPPPNPKALPGDTRRLRGIPASAAASHRRMPGTDPWLALQAKEDQNGRRPRS